MDHKVKEVFMPRLDMRVVLYSSKYYFPTAEHIRLAIAENTSCVSCYSLLFDESTFITNKNIYFLSLFD